MIINEVMTAAEAAVIWGLSPRTVQQACTGYKGGKPRFTTEEARLSGRIWLVTRKGMERLYGNTCRDSRVESVESHSEVN